MQSHHFVCAGKSPPESAVKGDVSVQEVHPQVGLTYAQPDPQTPTSISSAGSVELSHRLTTPVSKSATPQVLGSLFQAKFIVAESPQETDTSTRTGATFGESYNVRFAVGGHGRLHCGRVPARAGHLHPDGGDACRYVNIIRRVCGFVRQSHCTRQQKHNAHHACSDCIYQADMCS